MNFPSDIRIIKPFASFSSEPHLITLGEKITISGNVRFITHDGGYWVLRNLYDNFLCNSTGEIKVGDNVFIGIDSIILPNVTIGHNVIIGAGSIVTKDIPSNTVFAGVPARHICSINEYKLKIEKQKND
ncbi:MAG: acetyltransferase-like isoleucine patch superfamily enzyme [Colwellia sp.]|jgi:acetyltransferase-like isoleucine patch superfamily enzyme